jgi:hypothetical protein
MKSTASDEPMPHYLHASDEFCGQQIRNGPSDGPTVHASVRPTP